MPFMVLATTCPLLPNGKLHETMQEKIYDFFNAEKLCRVADGGTVDPA